MVADLARGAGTQLITPHWRLRADEALRDLSTSWRFRKQAMKRLRLPLAVRHWISTTLAGLLVAHPVWRRAGQLVDLDLPRARVTSHLARPAEHV